MAKASGRFQFSLRELFGATDGAAVWLFVLLVLKRDFEAPLWVTLITGACVIPCGVIAILSDGTRQSFIWVLAAAVFASISLVAYIAVHALIFDVMPP